MEETGGENDFSPAYAEKGCFVKFVDLPRRSLPLVALLSPLLLSCFSFFFFTENAEAWQARDRSQDALRWNAAAKRGIPTEIYIRNGVQ